MHRTDGLLVWTQLTCLHVSDRSEPLPPTRLVLVAQNNILSESVPSGRASGTIYSSVTLLLVVDNAAFMVGHIEHRCRNGIRRYGRCL